VHLGITDDLEADSTARDAHLLAGEVLDRWFR
jgi:hypothetical protein